MRSSRRSAAATWRRSCAMTITASGGPFRQWSAERIAAATRAEALAHPNWAMGPKVTIDSATMMNKGLELIEAHHLFDTPAERLAVVVHPQSIVHGLVAFADGSLIAGLASPDMRTPIAHCLGLSGAHLLRRRRPRSRRAGEADIRAGRPRPVPRHGAGDSGARRGRRRTDRAQRRKRSRGRRLSRRADRLRDDPAARRANACGHARGGRDRRAGDGCGGSGDSPYRAR